MYVTVLSPNQSRITQTHSKHGGHMVISVLMLFIILLGWLSMPFIIENPNKPVGELSEYIYILIQPCRTVQDGKVELWQSPGCCLYPHLLPTYTVGFKTDPPLLYPLLSTAQSLYSPQHPSLKSGRSHQGLALSYVSLTRGGICQGHSACLCVPPSLLHGKISTCCNWIQEKHRPFLYFRL